MTTQQGEDDGLYCLDELFGCSGETKCPKSRLAVFIFDDLDKTERKPFVKSLILRIFKARKVIGGIGFFVKVASFFVDGDCLCIALISKDPLRYSKWRMVKDGIDAKEVRISNIKSTRHSLYAVSEMFPGKTTIDVLMKNQIEVNFDKANRSFEGPRKPSNPLGKGRMQEPPKEFGKPPSSQESGLRDRNGRSPLERVRASKGVTVDPAQALVPRQTSAVYGVSVYGQLIDEAVRFLRADTLEPADSFLDKVYKFVSADGATNVTTFLLEGKLLYVFAHAIHLKQVVYGILSSRYGIDITVFSVNGFMSCPNFFALTQVDQNLLLEIGDAYDQIPDHPSFLLLDRISVGVFIALYILGEEINGSGSFLKDDFMSTHMGAVAEHVRMYVNIIFPMSKYVNLQISRNVVEREHVTKLVFHECLEKSIILDMFLGDSFPRSVRTIADKSRKEFRLKIFNSMLPKILKRYGIERFGIAFELWNVMQRAGVFFSQMNVGDPCFRLLPSTSFSSDISHHSNRIDDVLVLADAVVASLG